MLNTGKYFSKWSLLIALGFFLSQHLVYASDFKLDGIYYNINPDGKSVEVTRDKNIYKGEIIIPANVLFEGKEYKVTAIDNHAFFGAEITSVSIPNSVTTIEEKAFHSAEITSISIPSSVTTIEEKAFGACKIGSLSIYMTNISAEVFTFSTISSLTIANGVTTIGEKAFDGVKTNDLSIPNSVTTIGAYAFQNTELNSLLIPNSILSIGQSAFWGCKVNSKIVSKMALPIVLEGFGFYDKTYQRTQLFVPKGAIESYKSTRGWMDFLNIAEDISTYTLSIKSIGNGVAFYGEETIRGTMKSYTVNEGTLATITFTPDNGYRIKSLKVNGSSKTTSTSYDVTVNADTSVEVEFEAIPPTTYTLSIKATGNGSASYDGQSIRGKTQTFTVNEGTKATITFTPDNGYRIKSLKVNGSSKTVSTNYDVTVNADTSVEVEFEVIPDDPTPTTYTLSIKATGNGSASYNGQSIRGKTQTFTVNEGTKVTIAFTPNNGYRIKSLKVNGSSKTASTSYDVTVNADTSVEVEFEEIPEDPTPTPTPTTYTLSIKAVGNGSANYGGEVIKESSRNYSINEGSSVSISFAPDEGYRIESVKVNGSNIGDGNSYSTTINANTTVEVVFEAIPVTTYTLTVTAIGNGVATFNGTEVRDGSQSFVVNEGPDAIISFTPDMGYKVDVVKADGNVVEVAESYTIGNITSDKTIEVAFAEMDRNFSIDGVGYQIESFDDNTVTLTGVQNSITLEVSDKISYQAQDWNIIGISENALENSDNLAAIIWNPEIPFTAKVANPNLLLYVKDEAYAPAGIRNVVVNGFAKAITLTDAQSGNNFYCPSAFITQSIIYTHNYDMKTGINESKGWETIALPFDVQQISHSGKGEIIPFARWNADNDMKPFWLYELTGTGFVEAEELKANTPYIISMPNNDLYPNDYQLSGRVTFSALNAEVKKSDDIQTATFGNNTFVPAFTNYNAESGYYVLNVNNDFETYQGSANVGSKFILNLRRIHPFEAYMTSTSGTRSIEIFDGMTTSIRDVLDITDSQKTQKVYDLSGRLIMTGTSLESIRQELPAGVYIINNKKMIIK